VEIVWIILNLLGMFLKNKVRGPGLTRRFRKLVLKNGVAHEAPRRCVELICVDYGTVIVMSGPELRVIEGVGLVRNQLLPTVPLKLVTESV